MSDEKKKRRKAGVSELALAFGVAFSNLLDPAKKSATEEIKKRRDIGDHEDGESGDGSGIKRSGRA